jgi:hypothetical protein
MAKTSIGLKQGKRIWELSPAKRLAFLAEGLPMILDSAQGCWEASQTLIGAPREAEILAGFAEEEAAKILILMDVVRCPPALLRNRLPVMMNWFYSHLARLLYAEAQRWRPSDIDELRRYVDESRKGHDLEGYAGEYIMPNWHLFQRESQLYVDIAASESAELHWSAPLHSDALFPDMKPDALELAEAFAALGLFSVRGLKAVAEVWGAVAFTGIEGYGERRRLTQALLARIIAEKLPAHMAEQAHVDRLYGRWQLPMYHLDFQLIDVPLEELKEAQEAMLHAEMGVGPYG